MQSTRRILLVEDNPDDERLTLRALSQIRPHPQISVARDGQEALDKLRDEDETPPDIVLLDLKLPKLSGIEVLEGIRSTVHTRHLIVVVLTSSDEPKDIKAAYERFANSYIRKPVDFDAFSRVVGQLGEYWLDTNVVP